MLKISTILNLFINLSSSLFGRKFSLFTFDLLNFNTIFNFIISQRGGMLNIVRKGMYLIVFDRIKN